MSPSDQPRKSSQRPPEFSKTAWPANQMAKRAIAATSSSGRNLYFLKRFFSREPVARHQRKESNSTTAFPTSTRQDMMKLLLSHMLYSRSYRVLAASLQAFAFRCRCRHLPLPHACLSSRSTAKRPKLSTRNGFWKPFVASRIVFQSKI